MDSDGLSHTIRRSLENSAKINLVSQYMTQSLFNHVQFGQKLNSFQKYWDGSTQHTYNPDEKVTNLLQNDDDSAGHPVVRAVSPD